MLTINLLQALPKTPLWDRLKRDGPPARRTTARESNVVFLRPYDEVVAMWRRSIAYANDPERLFARFRHQVARDLREPQGDAREGQAHLDEPARRRGDGVADGALHLPPVGLPQRILAAPRSTRCVTARSTACSARLS